MNAYSVVSPRLGVDDVGLDDLKEGIVVHDVPVEGPSGQTRHRRLGEDEQELLRHLAGAVAHKRDADLGRRLARRDDEGAGHRLIILSRVRAPVARVTGRVSVGRSIVHRHGPAAGPREGDGEDHLASGLVPFERRGIRHGQDRLRVVIDDRSRRLGVREAGPVGVREHERERFVGFVDRIGVHGHDDLPDELPVAELERPRGLGEVGTGARGTGDRRVVHRRAGTARVRQCHGEDRIDRSLVSLDDGDVVDREGAIDLGTRGPGGADGHDQ